MRTYYKFVFGDKIKLFRHIFDLCAACQKKNTLETLLLSVRTVFSGADFSNPLNAIFLNLFYLPDLLGPNPTLPVAESHHALRALRLRKGDRLWATDGLGHFAECTLGEPPLPPKKNVPADVGCAVEVVSLETKLRPANALHLAVAVPKNPERLDWLIEKATEMGMAQFTPLLTKRTEKSSVKQERLQTLAISAMKQSQQCWLPVIHPPRPYEDFVRDANLSADYQGFIAHCLPDNGVFLGKILRADAPCTVLIGPEGDFTPEEIEGALAKGFVPVSLGNNRLRTETAGMFVAALVYAVNAQ